MLKIWMIDLAREQSPTLDHLYHYATVAQQAGYDALGLYLEHRFAYASAPWASGKGAVTPEQIGHLRAEFPSLRLIPFLNLLGHMEGFLYTEEGRAFHEEPLSGLQACPCSPGFAEFCHGLLSDVLACFPDEIVHIGGDETAQLARCDRCKEATANDSDAKAALYGRHFGPLIEQVRSAGRRAAIWGDMALKHPQILEWIPADTIIFDWQYVDGLGESASRFARYEVVGCPTTAVYNAAWMHTVRTENNIRACARDIRSMRLAGFCLTSWEQVLFNPFDSIFPSVGWAARIAEEPDSTNTLVESFGDGAQWARIMGEELQALGGVWAASGHRHKLKSRLLLSGDPFLAWFHHQVEAEPMRSREVLTLLERALHYAPDEASTNVTLAVRTMVECLAMMAEAHRDYADGRADAAIGKLAPMRMAFDTLASIGRKNHARIGSSIADVERANHAKRWLEIAIQRIRDFGNRELGYLPAFEILTHPRFTPHDQGCWWLVNRWAAD